MGFLDRLRKRVADDAQGSADNETRDESSGGGGAVWKDSEVAPQPGRKGANGAPGGVPSPRKEIEMTGENTAKAVRPRHLNSEVPRGHKHIGTNFRARFLRDLYRKKESEFTPENALKRLEAAMLIQRVFKGRLMRLEKERLVRDREIHFRRGELVDRLLVAPRNRATMGCGGCYLVFVLVFTLLLAYSTSPTLLYGSGGYLKDSLLSSSYSGGSGTDGWTVRTPADWYLWANAALGSTMKLSGVNGVFIQGDGAQMTDSVFIMQKRSTTTDCSNIYTRFSQLPPYDETDYCALPLSEGESTDSYGNTTSSSTAMASYSLSPNDSQYASITSKTECVMFTYATSLSPFGSGHVVELPNYQRNKALTDSDWTTILGVMENCLYIDRSTRQVEVQVSALFGNREPLFSWIRILHEFGLEAEVSVSYSVVTVNIKDKDSDSNRDVAYGCVVTLYILLVMGMAAVLVDIGLEVFMLGWKRGVGRGVTDPWTWIALAHYSLVLVSISYWLDIDALIQDLENADSFNDIRRSAEDINTESINYRIVNGVVVMFTYIRVLQYVRHRGMMSVLVQSLYRVFTPLLHFCITFGVVFMGFVVAAWQLFGSGVYSYSTVYLSLQTLLSALFGDFDYAELSRDNEDVAFMFFYFFMILCAVILMNFFVAIVLEGYSVVIQMSRFQLTAWGELGENVREHHEHMSGKCVSSMELAWVLINDPIYSRQRLVSLLDVRQGFRLPFTSEVTEVLYAQLVEVENADPLDAACVREQPYRYLFVKRFMDPSWVHKFPTDWRVVILRCNFFLHYYAARITKLLKLVRRTASMSRDMQRRPSQLVRTTTKPGEEP